MIKYFSVPESMVHHHLNRSAFATLIKVYSPIKHGLIQTAWSSFDCDTLKFTCTYQKVNQNWFDRMIGRTRYKLIRVSNPVLGTQALEGAPSKEQINTIAWKDLSHMDIKYCNYRTWIE